MVRALDDGLTAGGAEQRLKVPPNSIEAEQSLLGGLMLDHTSWDKIADVVTADDFYRKDHRLIFSAIATLAEGANPCDVVTVSEFLDNRGELDDAGGLEYLATLANETPGAANARSYARILRERSMLRSLITAGNEISGAAFVTEGRSASEIVHIPYHEVYGPRFEDMRRRAPDLNKLQRMIDYQPSYTMDDILREVIHYYRQGNRRSLEKAFL